MKYGTWKLAGADDSSIPALEAAGISPLVAAVLASRGYDDPASARDFLDGCDKPLHDPFLMPDMAPAVARIRQAVADNALIAVYGDYDVDGITATCLLTQYLRGLGARCTFYIPGRIEEGYGLNTAAITALRAQGVSLIVTVDCGITATDEARLCQMLGIDLIITDHHACREALPEAVAVINPHRPDSGYPFAQLAGVGVAFKLAAALEGDQQAVFNRFCDLVCLGTVADVMPLLDENRAFVSRGIQALNHSPRPGVRQLISQCGVTAVTATAIGYVLSPRINAAGRLGQVELATELILTADEARAAELAEKLCALNRQRQAIEQEIYADAQRMLAGQEHPDVIVLAGSAWHQGVVGIVASRLTEDYCCPTFLICLDGSRGKASSRSYGGFNLFAALEQNADLLESFGGHELAAGFTILERNVDEFRDRMAALARDYYAHAPTGSVLAVDYALPGAAQLSLENVTALDRLEPCGSGFPKPVFSLDAVRVEQLTQVGGGKHLRLRLSRDGFSFYAIFFSASELKAGVSEGDSVEIAFCPQLNEYRGYRSVQLNLSDIRPDAAARMAAQAEADVYGHFREGLLSTAEAAALLPPRQEFVAVWRYLNTQSRDGSLRSDVNCLARRISRYAGLPCSYMRTRICLDVFAECGLIDLDGQASGLAITITSSGRKVDLNQSSIITQLKHRKEGE